MGGQEAVCPVRWPSLWQSQLGHHDVSGQVLVFGTQSIGDPRPDSRIATESAARVHVQQRFRVIERLGLTSSVDAEFVSNFWIGKKLPLIRHLDSRVANFLRFEGTADIESFPRCQPCGSLGFFEVQLSQRRFWIERVDVRRSAFHEQHDHRLRFWLVHRRFGLQWRRDRLLVLGLLFGLKH